MSDWDPELYLRFGDERIRPARDLLARVDLDRPRRIVDLGCGPGNSTALLRARWPEAHILGVDNSPEMIDAAARSMPAGDWRLADAAVWAPDQPLDLIFSNAALQWVPDHAKLFPRLMEQLAPAGVLAVQMPAHLHSPVHRLMLQIGDEPSWRDRLQSAKTAVVVHDPGFYYDLLTRLCRRVDLWATEYLHILDGPRSIVEWIRGTGLRPFLEPLQPDDQDRFVDRLLAGVSAAYPRQTDGRVLFPFRRLFLVAHVAGDD